MAPKEKAAQGLQPEAALKTSCSHNSTPVERKARPELCELICGDKFFNRHASLEIDRLTAEVDALRALLLERGKTS